MQLGLKVHYQLVFVDGFAQLILQLQPFQAVGAQLAGVELPAVTTQMLGVLHRLVGLGDQQQAVASGGREYADADGGGGYQLVLGHQHRFTQGFEQLAGQRAEFLFIVGLFDNHYKFVCRQSRQGVLTVDLGAEPARHLLQQAVCHGVAQGDVDVLEAVQVYVQQRNRVVMLTGAGNRVLQAVGK